MPIATQQQAELGAAHGEGCHAERTVTPATMGIQAQIVLPCPRRYLLAHAGTETKIALSHTRCANGVVIFVALKYLNEHSAYGLYPNLMPREQPAPNNTVRPRLRLVAKATGKEA